MQYILKYPGPGIFSLKKMYVLLSLRELCIKCGYITYKSINKPKEIVQRDQIYV